MYVNIVTHYTTFIITYFTCFVFHHWLLLSFSSFLIWYMIYSDSSGGIPLFVPSYRSSKPSLLYPFSHSKAQTRITCAFLLQYEMEFIHRLVF